MKTYGFDGDAPQLSGQRKVTSVYVYEAPLRLWHWITVLSIIVLSVTGYFIGKPLPSVCHSFVTDGRIQFLADSNHALAGQTVDLPEVEA